MNILIDQICVFKSIFEFCFLVFCFFLNFRSESRLSKCVSIGFNSWLGDWFLIGWFHLRNWICFDIWFSLCHVHVIISLLWLLIGFKDFGFIIYPYFVYCLESLPSFKKGRWDIVVKVLFLLFSSTLGSKYIFLSLVYYPLSNLCILHRWSLLFLFLLLFFIRTIFLTDGYRPTSASRLLHYRL